MAEPARIVHVTTSYPVGNETAGWFVHEIVEAQRALGAQVGVVHPRRNGVLGALSRPLAWPRLLRALLTLRRQVRRAARELDADVIHAHWWPTALVCLLARTRVPVVSTLHGSDVALLRLAPLRLLARATLTRCAGVSAVSEYLAAEVARQCGEVDSGKGIMRPCVVARVIRHGDSLDAAPSRPAGPPSGIVFAGTLVQHKGVRDLWPLVQRLRELGCDEPVHIVGDGPLRAELERTFAPDDSVTVHGGLAHEATLMLLSSAAVVVCPSYVEGYGLVCQEALNRGTRVAAYATGGLIEQLAGVDPARGRAVKTGDVAALAEAAAELAADARDGMAAAQPGSELPRNWRDAAVEYLGWYESCFLSRQ